MSFACEVQLSVSRSRLWGCGKISVFLKKIVRLPCLVTRPLSPSVCAVINRQNDLGDVTWMKLQMQSNKRPETEEAVQELGNVLL